MKNSYWWKLITANGTTHESSDIRTLQIKQLECGGFIWKVLI